MLEKRIRALISLLPIFLCAAQHSSGSTTNFSFASFSQNNSQQLIYIGAANFSAEYGYIDITPDINPTINVSSPNETDSNLLQRNGRVLYRQQITMWPASFTTVFTIFVKNITAIRNFNGDGIAFIIVPDNKSLLANSAGAFLGLFNQSTDGNTTGQLAIEFDAFHNEFDPPDGNHVGIDISGIKSDATANMGDYGMDIKAGRAIEVRIDYDGWTKSLQIFARYADNTWAYASLLNRTVELEKTVPRSAYMGFSAATGNSFEIQRILNWNFSSMILPESSLHLARPRGLGAGVKVGVLVGLITVGLVMVGLLASWFVVKKLKGKIQATTTLGQGSSFNRDLAIIQNAPRQFSYKQLAAATNNFSEAELLGTGGFGSVYRGNLNAGGNEEVALVAVKRISARSKQGEREFISEIITIGRLRHRNLVQLQGWCHERDELLLVYDYMPNGSLDKFLYDRTSDLQITVLLALALVLPFASAANYTVGDSSQWESGVNYANWVSGKTFLVGDKLVFTYTTQHTVLEVNMTEYNSCNTANPIATNSVSPTTVTLSKIGQRFFICGTPNHCSNGMKLALNVSAAGTPTPPPPPGATTSSPPPPGSTTSSPPPPPGSPTSSPPPPPNAAGSLYVRRMDVLMAFAFCLVAVLLSQ